MNYNQSTRTFTCDPTLTDTQVLEYCRNGYLLLNGVVPDEINQRTCDYMNGKIPANPSYIHDGLTPEDLDRIRNSHKPSTILLEDWFIENVLLNPQLAGALRSLLGKTVGMPVLVSSHRVDCPREAQRWHQDADHVFGPEVNYVEVFYFPQDTPLELGPTELVPGSHICHTERSPDEKGVLSDGPAGSFGIHTQCILHRMDESTAKGVSHMLKFNYWRTVPPERDWIVEPDFDFRTVEYGGHFIARYIAHMFYWLCGKGDEYRIMGGQAWPMSTPNMIGPAYGFGLKEGYLPN